MSLPRRPRELACRIMRAVVCASVVLAQVIAVVGFPVLVTASNARQHECSTAACGCSEELHQSRSCCCAPVKPVKRSCCQKSAATEAAASEPKQFRWVAGVAMQKCKGDTPLALQAGEPLLPVLAMAMRFSADDSAGSLATYSDSLPAFDLDPPIPPPRLG